MTNKEPNATLKAVSFFIPIVGIVIGLTMMCKEDRRGPIVLAHGLLGAALFIVFAAIRAAA